jgi:hypothetical protein
VSVDDVAAISSSFSFLNFSLFSLAFCRLFLSRLSWVGVFLFVYFFFSPPFANGLIIFPVKGLYRH